MPGAVLLFPSRRFCEQLMKNREAENWQEHVDSGLSLSLSLSLSLCAPPAQSVSLCLSLSVSVCLCLSLSVSVCLCLSLPVARAPVGAHSLLITHAPTNDSPLSHPFCFSL